MPASIRIEICWRAFVACPARHTQVHGTDNWAGVVRWSQRALAVTDTRARLCSRQAQNLRAIPIMEPGLTGVCGLFCCHTGVDFQWKKPTRSAGRNWRRSKAQIAFLQISANRFESIYLASGVFCYQNGRIFFIENCAWLLLLPALALLIRLSTRFRCWICTSWTGIRNDSLTLCSSRLFCESRRQEETGSSVVNLGKHPKGLPRAPDHKNHDC